MGVADLLQHLRAAGFTLDVANGKLLVKPASMLTDDLRVTLTASKPEVLALLAAEREADKEAFDERAAIMEFDGGLPRADAERAACLCIECEHFGRRRTCLEPVAARLMRSGFGIRWPDPTRAATCPAFRAKAPAEAPDRSE